jgi:hypothetical protein
MNPAPIVLFVYNRPEQTIQTLKALKANEFSEVSELYIYAEGPKGNASIETLDKIKKVREIIRGEKWCGAVHIKESQINKGCAESIISGITEVINKHDRVIVLEDDIVTAKGFLNFMNYSLEFYKGENNVWGISGWTVKNNLIKKDTFFLPIPCPWGWATWKRAWDNFEPNIDKLLTGTLDYKEAFNFGGHGYYKMLLDQKHGNIDAWDIRWYASMFLKNGLFLFSDKSLTKNIGFNNSGTHTSNEFGENEIGADFIEVTPQFPSLNNKTVIKYSKAWKYKESLFRKIINKIK